MMIYNAHTGWREVIKENSFGGLDTPAPVREDHHIRELKRRYDDNCEAIENMFRGVIGYYKNLKSEFEQQTNSVGKIEELEGLRKLLQPHLAQFHGWSSHA